MYFDHAVAVLADFCCGANEDGFHLRVANSIWGQQGYPFETPFLDTLALNYGAGLPKPLGCDVDVAPIISLGSFSKIMAPGLRLGWIQTGKRIMARWIARTRADVCQPRRG